MGMLIAFAAGFVVGARTGKKEFEDLTTSLRALRDSQEFADVVAAARAHMSHGLRELASVLDGAASASAGDSEDVVTRVKVLFGRE
jgi:hypothetical protein